MIKITEVSALQEMADYQEAWSHILSESETDVVYLTYEWVLSCWQGFGGGKELLVLVAEENSKVVGIAPLAITIRRAFGRCIRTIEFISTVWADYNDIIVSKELKKRVLAAMFSYLSSIQDRWDLLKLDEIPSESSTILFSEQLAKRHFKHCKITGASVCPRLIIEGHIDEIESNLLGRKDFKYRHNWLKRQGRLTYSDYQSQEELLSIINTYFDYHINRWESTETKSLFYRSENREFFRRLVKNMFGTGYLKFSVLSLDGLALGFCFGFDYKGTVIRYKSTFNNAFRKRSPGLVLLKCMIEEAISKKIYCIDYVRGVENYKSGISNSQKQNKCAYIYSTTNAWVPNEVRRRISESRLLRWLRTKKTYRRLRRAIGDYRRRHGSLFIIRILQYLLERVLILSRSHLFSTTKLPDKTVVAKCSIDIRKGTAKDVWLVASAYGYVEGSAGRGEIEKAFETGDECFLAFEGQNLAHCSWARRGGSIGIGLNQLYKLNLTPEEVCVYHCHTSPVYRGMGIYPAVLQYIQKEYFSRGVKKMYICCSFKNVSSAQGIRKAGFSQQKIIRIMKLFGKKVFAR